MERSGMSVALMKTTRGEAAIRRLHVQTSRSRAAHPPRCPLNVVRARLVQVTAGHPVASRLERLLPCGVGHADLEWKNPIEPGAPHSRTRTHMARGPGDFKATGKRPRTRTGPIREQGPSGGAASEEAGGLPGRAGDAGKGSGHERAEASGSRYLLARHGFRAGPASMLPACRYLKTPTARRIAMRIAAPTTAMM